MKSTAKASEKKRIEREFACSIDLAFLVFFINHFLPAAASLPMLVAVLVRVVFVRLPS